MRLYREETKWEAASAVNHWYLLDDSMSTIHGYRKFATGPVNMLRTPLPFYVKGRRLVLEHDFGDFGDRAPAITVQGSNGRTHTIRQTASGYKCSCESFKFRSRCKHIEQVV